jgi:hypothetical protein
VKFKTLAIDSGGELARLAFSWEMKKDLGDYDNIRGMNDYPGMTERINMIMRRLKDLRTAGLEVVVIFHDAIDKIYARGSAMAKRGQNSEPTAIIPRIAMPGSVAPEETMKVADNIFHVRVLNGKVVWVCSKEPVGPGAPETWAVKDRFNAEATIGSFLPPSYKEIRELMEKKSPSDWHPPYIWMPYGTVGLKKTLSLATFPRPIRILDLDNGTAVLSSVVEKDPSGFHITQYNSEYHPDWTRFVIDLEEMLEDPEGVKKAKVRLGIK